MTVTHTKAENAPPSLTLGGYDTSRLTPNDVTFSFSQSPLRRFIVAIQAISVTNSLAESQLLPTGIYTLVDSTVPHIWLPLAACQAFEDAFGIIFDPISNFYIVNDTQHEAMLKQGAEVTFQLGTSLIGGSMINITLPYASFDLEIGPPFTKSPKRYFPLRRAKDETQYTLGRTFLQEASVKPYRSCGRQANALLGSSSSIMTTSGFPSHRLNTPKERLDM